MAACIDQETNKFDNLPLICYNKVYFPVTEKIIVETGHENKFGGDIPFFIEGESWPMHEEIPMAFFCQLVDPQTNNNILYRIFIAVDNDYECINNYITKIELNNENLKKQIIIHKPKNNKELTKFTPYEIIEWNTSNELKDCDSLCEILKIDSTNTVDYNKLRDKFYDENNYGIKVGGTPSFTQYADKKMYQKYNFLQLTGTKILSYDWGDSGIAHITNDCELYWDCC
jgi:uncharacterized protein YwqG